jgi:hypothetical protein
MTDAQGRAVARGLRPNQVQGRWEMRVTASAGGQTASTVIVEANAVAAAGGASAGTAAGLSAKTIAIIAVAAGAAVAGGVVAGIRLSGGGSGSSNQTIISAGTGTVGAPR